MKVREETKTITITLRYFIDGDFEWKLYDLYETLEMLNDPLSYVKVTEKKLEDYLIEKGVITKYMRHNETTELKFEEFFNKVTKLAYGED